jgi:hypothetical protein
MKGDEYFAIFVNGVEKAQRDAESSFKDSIVNFAAGELKAGWNEIRLITQAFGTCYWEIDCYRFWTELDEGFANPDYVPGLIMSIR